jgi:hypothetical protein
MRFNAHNVDIDDELTDALRNGTLVVFVGAGVSAKAYSGQALNTFYPNFIGLVQEIAKRTDMPLSQSESEMLEHGLSDRV